MRTAILRSGSRLIVGAALLLAASSLAPRAEDGQQGMNGADELGTYVGLYVDADNAGNRMEIAEDEGILRVRGGTDAFAYELGCLVTQGKAACMGNGGKLEGENFLYESMIEFADDGSAVETWKAFNNQQAAEGATNWRREQ
jgi:hypothetical protein